MAYYLTKHKANFTFLMPTSSKRRLPLSVSDINFVCTSHFQHTCNINSKRNNFYLIIVRTFGEEYKLWSSLWSNFFLEYYFMYLRSRYLHKHTVLKSLKYVLLSEREMKFHAHTKHTAYCNLFIINKTLISLCPFTGTWQRYWLILKRGVNGTWQITRRDT
jgi:hypothetical protein